jgi:hypothetical protein
LPVADRSHHSGPLRHEERNVRNHTHCVRTSGRRKRQPP